MHGQLNSIKGVIENVAALDVICEAGKHIIVFIAYSQTNRLQSCEQWLYTETQQPISAVV